MKGSQPLKNLRCLLVSDHFLGKLPLSLWHSPFKSPCSWLSSGLHLTGVGVKEFQSVGLRPSGHTEPEPLHSQVEESSLPLPQRCKSSLAANWRGQLTTIKADATVQDVSALRGSLVPFVLLDGKPLVWLPEDSPQSLDLQDDAKGSLMVGHTDPSALTHLFRNASHVLPRVVVLGELVPVPESEAAYLRRRAGKAAATATNMAKRAAPELANLLTEGKSSIEARNEMLAPLLSARDGTSDALGPPQVPYRLLPREFVYMDIAGKRHTIPADDVTGALTDPLAPVVVPLVEGINHDLERRKALILFCAAHLQIHVKDAYVFSVDRWGFDLLALPVAATPGSGAAAGGGGSRTATPHGEPFGLPSLESCRTRKPLADSLWKWSWRSHPPSQRKPSRISAAVWHRWVIRLRVSWGSNALYRTESVITLTSLSGREKVVEMYNKEPDSLKMMHLPAREFFVYTTPTLHLETSLNACSTAMGVFM